MAEEIVPTSLEDFLQDQLGTQRAVYGCDPSGFSREEQVRYIRDNALALTHEVHEALKETPWKLWMYDGSQIRTAHYLDELVDAQNFLWNLMLATGISPAELARTFEERFYLKKKLNVQRHGGA